MKTDKSPGRRSMKPRITTDPVSIHCPDCATFTPHTFRAESLRHDGSYAQLYGCELCQHLRRFGATTVSVRPGLGLQ